LVITISDDSPPPQERTDVESGRGWNDWHGNNDSSMGSGHDTDSSQSLQGESTSHVEDNSLAVAEEQHLAEQANMADDEDEEGEDALEPLFFHHISASSSDQDEGFTESNQGSANLDTMADVLRLPPLPPAPDKEAAVPPPPPTAPDNEAAVPPPPPTAPDNEAAVPHSGFQGPSQQLIAENAALRRQLDATLLENHHLRQHVEALNSALIALASVQATGQVSAAAVPGILTGGAHRLAQGSLPSAMAPSPATFPSPAATANLPAATGGLTRAESSRQNNKSGGQQKLARDRRNMRKKAKLQQRQETLKKHDDVWRQHHLAECLFLEAMSLDVTEDEGQGAEIIGITPPEGTPVYKKKPFWRAQQMDSLYVRLDALFEQERLIRTGKDKKARRPWLGQERFTTPPPIDVPVAELAKCHKWMVSREIHQQFPLATANVKPNVILPDQPGSSTAFSDPDQWGSPLVLGAVEQRNN